MIKRALDVLGAAIGLIVFSPMLIVISLMIPRQMGSPLLFRQTRPGIHGKPYEMIKFRTMRDAIDVDGNPNEAAPSAHAQKVFTGHEQIAEFDTAWDIRENRKAGSFEGTLGIREGDPAHMSYSHAYMLGTQVERLLNVAPKEQIFILLIDDLRDDRDATLHSLASFLDVTWNPAPHVSTANKATRRRFPIVHSLLLRSYLLKQRVFPNFSTGFLRKINRINSVEEKYDPPSDRSVVEMKQIFLPEIQKLEMLIDRDLTHWK